MDTNESKVCPISSVHGVSWDNPLYLTSIRAHTTLHAFLFVLIKESRNLMDQLLGLLNVTGQGSGYNTNIHRIDK